MKYLFPPPDYPLWTAAVTLAGGNAVHYICDEQNEWNPDIDDIKKKITDRTKGIVIINPNNPTGALYSEEILKEIVEVARSHQLIILFGRDIRQTCYGFVKTHFDSLSRSGYSVHYL